MRLLLLLLFSLSLTGTALAKDRFLTTTLGQNKLVTSADNVEVLANSSGEVAVKDVVYLSAAGTVAKASATTTAQPAFGIVIELVDATHCRVLTRGVVDSFSTGMTAGTAYYLSETSGTLQTTPVLGSGKLTQYVGFAVSTTALMVEPQNMSLSGTSGGQLVTMTYDGKLPVVDGSNLTNLPSGGMGGTAGTTDNALVRANGTGGSVLQGSALICDDSGNLSGINNITLSGTVDGVDVSSIASTYQPVDATLTAVASWAWTSGTEVKTLTAADTFGTLRVGTAASNLVQLDSSALVPRANVAYSSVAENVQVFTQTGANTWTPPTNYTSVTVILVGGGGSGGSGYKGASGSGRPGGCGGGGGGTTIMTFPASTVGTSNVTVTVGAGNTSPGAARTADGSPGLAGGAGGDTTFGTFARAGGGGGGTGGVVTGTFAGGVGGTGTIPGGTGATSSASATVDATATLFGGTAGGGAGGGITTGNVDIVGGAGAAGSTFISATGLAGGVGGTTGSHAGGSATDSSVSTGAAYVATCGGGGGGGYGSNASSAGGTGAAGGLYGGGGGGGGAGKNATTNSGAGGNGANGVAIVISRF